MVNDILNGWKNTASGVLEGALAYAALIGANLPQGWRGWAAFALAAGLTVSGYAKKDA